MMELIKISSELQFWKVAAQLTRYRLLLQLGLRIRRLGMKLLQALGEFLILGFVKVANVDRCNGTANVFKCVQAADSALLFTVVNAVGAKAPLPSSIWPWQPVIDGKFVADYPSKLTAAGKFTKVPMIIGRFFLWTVNNLSLTFLRVYDR
jgi:hypothetical protein